MTRTLIVKELRQHWWAFLTVALLSGVGLVILFLQMTVTGEAGSRLDVLRGYTLFVGVSAAILGNRLVVAEYTGRTQLFLEALPLPRIRMVLGKYLLGLSVVATICGAGLVAAVLFSLGTEAFTPEFLGVLSARFGVSSIFYYNFFFMTGFFGRYRIVFFCIIAFAILFLQEARDFELEKFGPFRLMDSTFAFEREIVPWHPLLVTLGAAAGFFTVSVFLATVREGSIASMCGERMSHREKVAISVLLLSLVFLAVFLDEKKAKQPYDLLGASEGSAGGFSVKVSPRSAAAETLATELAGELAALRDYLGIHDLPPLFVILRRDLDPDLHEKGALENAEGLVVRANFTSPGWKRENFLGFIVEHLLLVRSEGRLSKEDRAWVLDGFALSWTRQKDSPGSFESSPDLLLRALYGVEIHGPITEENLKQCYRLRDRLGREVFAGIAWSGLKTLEMVSGPGECRAFLRSVLAEETPKDLRTTLHDLSDPVTRRLERNAGMPVEEFLDAWNDALAARRAEQSATLAMLSRIEGQVSFEELSSDSFLAKFQLEEGAATGNLERAYLVYGTLEPFQTHVPEVLRRRLRIDLSDPEKLHGALPEDYPRGTRLFYTFSAFDETLGCRLISGWRRREVP